jgi:hypothetical protein
MLQEALAVRHLVSKTAMQSSFMIVINVTKHCTQCLHACAWPIKNLVNSEDDEMFYNGLEDDDLRSFRLVCSLHMQRFIDEALFWNWRVPLILIS